MFYRFRISNLALLVHLVLAGCLNSANQYDPELHGNVPSSAGVPDTGSGQPADGPATASTQEPGDSGTAAPDDALAGGGSCQPGFHPCFGRCVEDMSTASCGQSCESCPSVAGGEATCDGKKCGASCSPGKKVCLGACIPDKDACANVCPAGKNLCNGRCAEPTSLEACGTACVACPSSPNGVSSCDGTSCELKCNAGYARCGDGCIAMGQPCNGMCLPGELLCNSRCVAGGPGSCCQDSECGACRRCQGFRCEATANGQPGPMCAGIACNGDTLAAKVCQAGQCSESSSGCNGYGCDGSAACRTTCPSNTFRQGNRCVPCGGDSGRCCPGDTRDCSNECGERGTARCNGSGSYDMSACPDRRAPGQTDRNSCGSACRRCGNNELCRGGNCELECGKQNQPCCPGASCDSGLYCDGTCKPQKGLGERCRNIRDECRPRGRNPNTNAETTVSCKEGFCCGSADQSFACSPPGTQCGSQTDCASLKCNTVTAIICFPSGNECPSGSGEGDPCTQSNGEPSTCRRRIVDGSCQ